MSNVWRQYRTKPDGISLPDQESNDEEKKHPKKEAIKFISFCIQFFSLYCSSVPISFSLLDRSFSCFHTVCRVPFIAPCAFVCVCEWVCPHSFKFSYLKLFDLRTHSLTFWWKKRRWNCEDTLDGIQAANTNIEYVKYRWISWPFINRPVFLFSSLFDFNVFYPKKSQNRNNRKRSKKEYLLRDTSDSNRLVFIKWRQLATERERDQQPISQKNKNYTCILHRLLVVSSFTPQPLPLTRLTFVCVLLDCSC